MFDFSFFIVNGIYFLKKIKKLRNNDLIIILKNF